MGNQYAAADARLAAVRGWTDVTVQNSDDGEYRIYGRLNHSSGCREVRLWSQDPGAAMQLIIEHNVWPHGTESHIHAQGTEHYNAIGAGRFSDHGNNAELTIRFALVQVTILTREAQFEQSNSAARTAQPKLN